MVEIWKDVTIDGLGKKYQVSNLGRVQTKAHTVVYLDGRVYEMKGMFIKPRVRLGYVKLNLSLDAKVKSYLAHRLIALAFIDNPECKPFINHIDGNGTNNKIENLEWCTQNENMDHSYYVLGKKFHKNKVINQLDLNGNVLNTFLSINKAIKHIGYGHRTGIDDVLNGKNKTAYGFKWELSC